MTPPFLVDQRVVILRDAGRLLTADVPRLVDVVANPLPTTVLIVVGGGGTVPAPLVRAITAAGQVIDTSVSKAGDRKAWLHDQFAPGPRQARAEGGPTPGGSTSGRTSPGWRDSSRRCRRPTAREPASASTTSSLTWGEAGNVPLYELTEAISRGETAAALGVLHRMFDAGGLSVVEVMATMNRHYAQLLLLDGATVSGEREAAELLGSAPFVAKKALDQTRRLGTARISQAITLLADADLDVKGGSGLPPELVIEIAGGATVPADPPARPPVAVRNLMHETPEELRQLQELLDASAAQAAPHLKSIITDDRRVDAAALCARMQGMRLLVAATVTADGRPLAARSTAIYSTGRSSSPPVGIRCACVIWPPGRVSVPRTSPAARNSR